MQALLWLAILVPQDEWWHRPDDPEARAIENAKRDLLDEISLLNLINGLNLSPAQMRKIADLAAAARRAAAVDRGQEVQIPRPFQLNATTSLCLQAGQ